MALVLASALYFKASSLTPGAAPGRIEDAEGDLSETDLRLPQVIREMRESATVAAHCQLEGAARRRLTVEVTFDNDGRAAEVEVLTEGLRGTTTSNCVKVVFKRTTLPTFTGPHVKVRQTFSLQN